MKPAHPEIQRIRRLLYVPLRAPLAAVLMLAGLSSQAQTVNITETFRQATAPDWSLHGHTTLTAATGADGDTAGTGWLRLTGSVDDQAGSAIYDQAFASTEGIDVQFEYATWRPDAGEGADGFTFYLIDGATAAPTVGARGGSLGYSWGEHGPGVTNGYVGIGFDEWGNFSNHRYGACNVTACAPGTTVWKNRVAVRGSGSLLGASAGADPQNKTTGFELLREVEAAPSGASNTRIVTGTRDDAKRVRILITPAPDVKMSVFLNGNTVIDAMPLAQSGTPVAGMVMLPATFKMGFSGSTGSLNNTHEIRNLRVVKSTLDAIDDTYTATPGQTLTVPLASGLGANDFGVLPTSVFTLTTPSPHGNVILNPDGGFSFTPNAGFSGATTFRYQVCNGAVCDTATATITVQAAGAITAVPVNAPWALALTALGMAGLARRTRALRR